MRISIDCGHTLNSGTSDYGANGVLRPESNLTREIGYRVIDKLKKLGHEVIDCTLDKANSLSESLAYRVDTANKSISDLFVSIHFNAFNGKAYGTEIWTYGGRQFTEATRTLNELVKLGYTNRGIKDGSNFYVLKNTKMKSMLVEVCFCDNSSDMAKYDVEKISNAIVLGLVGELPKELIKEISVDNNKIYRVQVGAFKDKSNAEKLLKELESKGFKGFIKEEILKG